MITFLDDIMGLVDNQRVSACASDAGINKDFLSADKCCCQALISGNLLAFLNSLNKPWVDASMPTSFFCFVRLSGGSSNEDLGGSSFLLEHNWHSDHRPPKPRRTAGALCKAGPPPKAARPLDREGVVCQEPCQRRLNQPTVYWVP